LDIPYLELPRGKLIVFCGVSGSGKSSLAFDTIYAEGRRRYVESLSVHTRQLLGGAERPEVEHIDGLSPAIAIDQRSAAGSPRSTVATLTDIHDFLRVLFARCGRPTCYQCGKTVEAYTVQQITDRLEALPEGTRYTVLAPVPEAEDLTFRQVIRAARRKGYARVRVDGTIYDLADAVGIDDPKAPHTVELVVDRLIAGRTSRARVAESVETALSEAQGLVVVEIQDGKDLRFSTRFACSECGALFPPITLSLFSFNNPEGMCPSCEGLGVVRDLDPELLISDPNKSVLAGALSPYSVAKSSVLRHQLEGLAQHYGFDINTPWRDLPEEIKRIILYGSGDTRIPFEYRSRDGKLFRYSRPFPGIIPADAAASSGSKTEGSALARFYGDIPCPDCGGTRLRPEALAVKIAGRSIADVAAMTITHALSFFDKLELSDTEELVAREVLREINARLSFMEHVGIGYLTLDRTAPSLAGGEAQRIRLATQLGSGLAGIVYILDEPSVGLHPRDQDRLIELLKRLRDLGNTVIVVEHDVMTIRAADWVVELGPGAGTDGGRITFSGTPEQLTECDDSLTGAYLKGTREIPLPARRRKGTGGKITVRGAAEHNLKGFNVDFPLGTLICVTGLSGSGKSTLVVDILYRGLRRYLHRAADKPGAHQRIVGYEQIDKVVSIDQAPIGRTPRSNPATYVGVFDEIRHLFAQAPEARVRGYKPGRFSFNVPGGRCETCRGEGRLRVELEFLPDVWVTCQECRGTRFNRETLSIRWRGKNIAEVLEMTVSEAAEYFASIPRVKAMLEVLEDVGLGYVRLGQPANTLSGGEAQRIKLARELGRPSTGRSFYILDEPTTGLHFADIEKLLQVLERLVDAGNTVVIIEHNLEVVKTADWIIDLGPEGGTNGGDVVAVGTPEQVARKRGSYTGEYLRQVLSLADETKRPKRSPAH